MGGLAGAGAALVILSAPVGLIELVVASTGLSEALPAAAPPLGMTARVLIAGFAALMAVGLVWAMGRQAAGVPRIGHAPHRESPHRDMQGAGKMGFAMSKLAALARGRILSPAGGHAPVLRRADAHPDAPSRPPIFASRDFSGLDIFARTEPGHREIIVAAEPESDPVVASAGLQMPSAPLPLAVEDLPPPAIARALRARPFEAPPVASDSGDPVAPMPMSVPSSPPEPSAAAACETDRLSIADLTARLERGLALRGEHAARGPIPAPAPPSTPPSVIARMPVAPAVPVRADVAPDVDDALRAALGTLRTMAARAR